MAASRIHRERARRQVQERRRKQTGEAPPPSRSNPPPPSLSDDARRRRAASDCAWCGGPIELKATGRIPTFCSPTCRHRSWEQTRAAASGRAAVRVVERRVEVPVEGHRDDWPTTLARLTRELDRFSIYDRDLEKVAVAVDDVIHALARRGRRRTQP